MASIGIGFLGEPAIASLLEDPLGDAVGHGAAVAISFAIAYVLVTTAHITVGEQVPKIYAITHPEPVVRRAARPLQGFPRHLQAVHLGAEQRVERDAPGARGRIRTPSSRTSRPPTT